MNTRRRLEKILDSILISGIGVIVLVFIKDKIIPAICIVESLSAIHQGGLCAPIGIEVLNKLVADNHFIPLWVSAAKIATPVAAGIKTIKIILIGIREKLN